MPYHAKLVRAIFGLIPEGSNILQMHEQFTIGLAFERAARRAAAPDEAYDDDGSDDELYGDEDMVLPEQARISHDMAAAHPATIKLFDKTILEVHGVVHATGCLVFRTKQPSFAPKQPSFAPDHLSTATLYIAIAPLRWSNTRQSTMGLDDHHTRSGIRCGYFRQILSLQFRSLRMLGVRNRSSSSIPSAIMLVLG